MIFLALGPKFAPHTTVFGTYGKLTRRHKFVNLDPSVIRNFFMKTVKCYEKFLVLVHYIKLYMASNRT